MSVVPYYRVDGRPMKLWVDTRCDFENPAARPICARPADSDEPAHVLFCQRVEMHGHVELVHEPGPSNPRVYLVSRHVTHLYGVGPETPRAVS